MDFEKYLEDEALEDEPYEGQQTVESLTSMRDTEEADSGGGVMLVVDQKNLPIETSWTLSNLALIDSESKCKC